MDDNDGTKFEEAIDNYIGTFPSNEDPLVFQIIFTDYPVLNGNCCVGTVLHKSGNFGEFAAILAFTYENRIAIKSKLNGVWGPWEWVNPRLDIGVEYRTVERYLGKPVYCKAINCGAFSGNKYVSSGIDYAKCAIVRCHGIIDSGSGMFPIAFFPNTATTPPAGICFTLSRAGGSYEIKIFDTGNAEGAITVTLYLLKIMGEFRLSL